MIRGILTIEGTKYETTNLRYSILAPLSLIHNDYKLMQLDFMRRHTANYYRATEEPSASNE